MAVVREKVVKAVSYVDVATWEALRKGYMQDRKELPTMAAVLNYCLKLGIETYIEGQPDE